MPLRSGMLYVTEGNKEFERESTHRASAAPPGRSSRACAAAAAAVGCAGAGAGAGHPEQRRSLS
jgi:hypothetical protein